MNEGGLDLKTISELPREPFRLTAVDLRENPSVTTAGLASFAGCSHLSSLSISGPGLTSEGLAHFKGNANLTSLTLAGPGVTDAGLAHFREMRDLSQVILTGTHITDAGLPVLHTAQRLLQLNLEATDVTADGLNTLKQALPQCRIEWSGGIIEPTLHPAVAPFGGPQAKHSQEAWAKHLGVEVERNNSIGMKLRLVPVGEFTMGTVPGAADRVAANPDWYFARWVRERRQAECPPRVVRISQPAGWPGVERFAKPRGFDQSDSSPGHPVVAGCVIESNDHGWSDRAMMPSSSARTASHE